MSFIHDHFLLHSEPAVRLYHDVARDQPIIDYHSHLPPDVIANNQPFASLYDIWLSGDHYKWRAMRAAGIPETHCTGNADPHQKFLAWCETVPQTLRNPLYHWTHLELKRYFDIDLLLGPDTAETVWQQCNEQLATDAFLPRSILQRFQVKIVCTTDDPADDLVHHRKLAAERELPFRMYPTFRPDAGFKIQDPEVWNQWRARLEAVSQTDISSLTQLLDALKRRHDDFHTLGCRLSDHGLSYCFRTDMTRSQAELVFDRVLAGKTVSEEQQDGFGGYLMRQLAVWDTEKNWTKQLHLGARRNNSQRLYRVAGADIGCDSIADWPQVDRLANYLDDLDRKGVLPKMVVYNLNPADNYAIATTLGNFQDGTLAGKIQWGSGWWFLDQKEAMQWQMNALSNLGLLSRFVGMLTDSRSFLSFPRHEYFRRVLCNLIGADVEAGELPDHPALLTSLIRGICFENARDLLGLELPAN